MKQGWRLNKKIAQLALILFATVSFSIIMIHSYVMGYGLHKDMTISSYVGLNYWSALVFAMSNVVVAGVFAVYVFMMADEWKMGEWWKLAGLGSAAMLVMLSVFPIGLFDEALGQYGVASVIHQFSSRIMFALMIVMAGMMFVRVKEGTFRVLTGMFLLYAIAMVVIFLFVAEIFWAHSLLFESMYLLCFLILLVLVPKNKKYDIITGKGR